MANTEMPSGGMYVEGGRRPEWPEIANWARKQIAAHERAIRQKGLPHDETEDSRSKIEVLEALLNLANPSNIREYD